MLRVRSLTLVVVTATVLSLSATAGATTKLSSAESALLWEINRVRAEYGVQRLEFDLTLTRAARAHTRTMTGEGFFAHGRFRVRMVRFGVTGLAGENLAWGAGELRAPQAIVAAWLASPHHRENLLRPGFNRVGLGELQTRFLGHDDAVVVTADFAGD